MNSCKKYLENIEKVFSHTQKMPFFAQNSLIYPKLQHNKDDFTKIWIVICKILSEYEIMQKIITKYCVDPELYTKNAIFGPNLPDLPNFWRLAYFFQNISKSPTSFPEFESACQKLAYFIILSLRYSRFKILQSDSPRAFWPINQEPEF